MYVKNMLETLMYLHNNLLFVVDIKNKKVNNIYKGSTLLKQEASFEETCDIFQQTFDLIDTFKPKLMRFLTNLEPQDDPFDLAINYTKTDSSQTTILYKGLKLDDDSVLFTISNESTVTQSSLDDLTKCNTKEYIEKVVNKAIKDKKEFVLMLVDIDNFKDFNETYGHMFGDMILIETAASIRKFLKNRGYVSRIGGDEFLVYLNIEDDYDVIHEACTNLRTMIAKLNGRNVKNATLSATIGCASHPKDGDSFELLYKKADAALLRGKNKGRNCFIIYLEEKCGKVTINDVIDNKRSMDKTVASVNNYNVISGIIELLNRKSSLKNNINDSMSLIGNYFVLDRISLCVLDPETGKIVDSLSWHNPLIDTPEIDYSTSNIDAWRKVYDKTHMLKINQLSSNTDLAVYELLKAQKTSAIVAFELEFEGKIYGQIRYDMCSINRFWQSTDVSALMLLSKTFAIKLSSEYLNHKHYNELYLDKLTGVRNFNRWLIDVNDDYVQKHDNYAILSLKIVDYFSLPSIVGAEECNRMIKRIASWGTKNCKEGIFCRATGDLFLLYTKEIDKNRLNQFFNALYDYIINTGRSKLNNIRIKVGCYIATNGENIEESLDRATLARESKITDDDLIFFSDDIYNDMMEQKTLELHIEDALKNNEFLLFIQPKISTRTGKIAAAEALTRWNFNFKKIIPPYKYIPLFERLGYITELDYMVFENVCKFLRDVIDKGQKPVPISVNVSRYTRDYEQYINTIDSIRDKYDIPATLLELEITEGMYTENVNDIKLFVNLLRRSGYTISIDDFGSGYSNLSNIAQLDFEVLKLDKSLCSMIDTTGVVILDAIIKTAKKTGHIIVCEGVETKEGVEKLTDLGADLIQGYYYDKPLEKDEFRNKYIN